MSHPNPAWNLLANKEAKTSVTSVHHIYSHTLMSALAQPNHPCSKLFNSNTISTAIEWVPPSCTSSWGNGHESAFSRSGKEAGVGHSSHWDISHAGLTVSVTLTMLISPLRSICPFHVRKLKYLIIVTPLEAEDQSCGGKRLALNTAGRTRLV